MQTQLNVSFLVFQNLSIVNVFVVFVNVAEVSKWTSVKFQERLSSARRIMPLLKLKGGEWIFRIDALTPVGSWRSCVLLGYTSEESRGECKCCATPAPRERPPTAASLA